MGVSNMPIFEDGYGGAIIRDDVRNLLDFIAETIVFNSERRRDDLQNLHKG